MTWQRTGSRNSSGTSPKEASEASYTALASMTALSERKTHGDETTANVCTRETKGVSLSPNESGGDEVSGHAELVTRRK